MDGDAVVMADPAGVICFWSAGAERAFGYPAAEAVGQTLDLIVPAEHREAHWNGFRRAIQSGAASAEGQSVPFPVRHADGELAVRPGRLTLVRRPQGEAVAALVVFDGAPRGRRPQNALSPVIARPRISACTSCAPS